MFSGKVFFGNFNRNTVIFNRKIGYSPIAVSAFCTYPDEPGRFYKCFYFFDLNLNTCKSSMVYAKVHTSHPAGLFTLDEAYGLNSNRTDGSDGQKECVICLTETKNVIAKPCKHVCMCFACAQALLTAQQPCPVCRQPIIDIVPFTI